MSTGLLAGPLAFAEPVYIRRVQPESGTEIAPALADYLSVSLSWGYEGSKKGDRLGQDVVFVALLGLALGVGKVADRLEFRDLVLIVFPIVATLAPFIVVYSWSFGFPIELILAWLFVCALLGVFSSRITEA